MSVFFKHLKHVATVFLTKAEQTRRRRKDLHLQPSESSWWHTGRMQKRRSSAGRHSTKAVARASSWRSGWHEVSLRSNLTCTTLRSSLPLSGLRQVWIILTLAILIYLLCEREGFAIYIIGKVPQESCYSVTATVKKLNNNQTHEAKAQRI